MYLCSASPWHSTGVDSMTQKKWRVLGKSVLESKRVNLTSDCCVRDGGTIKQQCPVETIEDMVLGGAH